MNKLLNIIFEIDESQTEEDIKINNLLYSLNKTNNILILKYIIILHSTGVIGQIKHLIL